MSDFIINRDNIIKYVRDYYKKYLKPPVIADKNHPFNYYQIKKIFNTWNELLIESNIPLNRNKNIIMECKLCKNVISKQFKEVMKSNNDFCSHSCAATYNNTGRKISEETKEKIRKKLQIIRFTNCQICDKEFSYRKRKKLTCSEKCLGDLKRLNNKKKKGLIIDYY
jgi:hypothetical protein